MGPAGPPPLSLAMPLVVASVGSAPVPTVVFACGGVALGVCTGLVPGLHANTMALLLAAVAPTVPAPPLSLATAMVAAGVVHTCLDVVPALALGVPDPSMAVSALPGHRLVLAGRGREALRLSAMGSGAALLVAVPAAVPVTAIATRAYPLVRAHFAVVVAAVVGALLLTESTWRRRGAGLCSFAASGLLGAVALDVPTGGLAVGGPLPALFGGLFGAPILLDAVDGDGVPRQADAALGLSRAGVGWAALAGTVGGAAVGYLPGVSAGVAATLSLPATPGTDPDREYVVATSAANTATAVFALFALVALGTPRSGVLVAVDRVGAPHALVPLLAATTFAGAVGVTLVAPLGDRVLRAVDRVDPTRLSVAALAGLIGLSALLTGAIGVAVFAAATVVGLLPVAAGGRRVYLMGVLLVPVATG
ncbi:MAG: tripartite tricarboxylate transporter permease [Halolamina sp.]